MPPCYYKNYSREESFSINMTLQNAPFPMFPRCNIDYLNAKNIDGSGIVVILTSAREIDSPRAHSRCVSPQTRSSTIVVSFTPRGAKEIGIFRCFVRVLLHCCAVEKFSTQLIACANIAISMIVV